MVGKIIEIAKGAGSIIRNYYGSLKKVDIEKKGFGHFVTFVTKADKEAEDFIIKNLQKSFPGVGICSEEGDPISGKGSFIIDPLDGTHNFMHGIARFCISIAYEENSEVKAGVVYEPIKDEIFSAEKDGGAFLNGERIKHSGQENLDRALVTVGIPPSAYERRGGILDALKSLILRVNSIRIFGAAALQLAEVAAGRIDGDMGFALSPWDVAAGWILVEEAGGVITDELGGNKILEGTIISGTPYVQKFLLDFVQNNVI
jgi:myo-inositol-1(or 4)-monophosphatase